MDPVDSFAAECPAVWLAALVAIPDLAAQSACAAVPRPLGSRSFRAPVAATPPPMIYGHSVRLVPGAGIGMTEEAARGTPTLVARDVPQRGVLTSGGYSFPAAKRPLPSPIPGDMYDHVVVEQSQKNRCRYKRLRPSD